MREYFVTAYEKKCPFPCKYYREEDFSCLYDKKSFIQTILPSGFLDSMGHTNPCNISFCPILEEIPLARLSVGELSEEEKNEVENWLGMNDKPIFMFADYYVLHKVDAAEMGITHDRPSLSNCRDSVLSFI